MRGIARTLSTILSQAVEDEILPANPALRLGRYLRRGDEPKAEIHPLTRDEAALPALTMPPRRPERPGHRQGSASHKSRSVDSRSRRSLAPGSSRRRDERGMGSTALIRPIVKRRRPTNEPVPRSSSPRLPATRRRMPTPGTTRSIGAGASRRSPAGRTPDVASSKRSTRTRAPPVSSRSFSSSIRLSARRARCHRASARRHATRTVARCSRA